MYAKSCSLVNAKRLPVNKIFSQDFPTSNGINMFPSYKLQSILFLFWCRMFATFVI